MKMKKAMKSEEPAQGVKVQLRIKKMDSPNPPGDVNNEPNDQDEENPPMNAAGAPSEHDDAALHEMAHHLVRAEEIKQNPELMAKIRPVLEKKKKAIHSLSDLKARAKEVLGSDRREY